MVGVIGPPSLNLSLNGAGVDICDSIAVGTEGGGIEKDKRGVVVAAEESMDCSGRVSPTSLRRGPGVEADSLLISAIGKWPF